jgi:flavin-dependent dehydrogenase
MTRRAGNGGGSDPAIHTPNRSRHDVVVVGARVAGSATAMVLARLGRDVAVVDQASFPSDTVSTHSIARSGVVQLHRWGLLDEVLASGAPAMWSGIEFFVAARSFAGVFPTHHGQACIWVCTPSADATAIRRRTSSRVEAFDQLLEGSAPQLAERLRHARRTSPVQGMLRQPNQVRQAFGPGWALVGDAGYYRDAVTAYGISDAFRDAELLAAALDQALGADAEEEETAALVPYQPQRDQALREVFEITCRLSAYPPVPAFVELQKQLAAAIDTQAAALAARPVPGERRLATA